MTAHVRFLSGKTMTIQADYNVLGDGWVEFRRTVTGEDGEAVPEVVAQVSAAAVESVIWS